MKMYNKNSEVSDCIIEVIKKIIKSILDKPKRKT